MLREAVLEGNYHYTLKREWDKNNSKSVVFILLNPSTADDEEDDQTTKICIEFAKRWGFGSMQIVDLFAYRATDPKELKRLDNYVTMVGKQNNVYIQKALNEADKIVVAWGEHGTLKNRYKDQELKELLSKYPLYCFRVIAKNQPKHPLGVSYHTPLIEYTYYKSEC
jgi:hypothetical protein